MTLAGASPKAAAAVLASVAAVAAAPSPAHADGSCAYAGAAATATSAAQSGAAVRCLINRTRAERGAPPLHASERLRRSATRHALDMVRRRYFAHVSPDGRTVQQRVRQTGYLRGGARWALGENIGWGTGELSTPASMLQAWMNSPPHRAVILDGRFRQAGVGIVRGVPVPGQEDGATFVLNVGVTR